MLSVCSSVLQPTPEQDIFVSALASKHNLILGNTVKTLLDLIILDWTLLPLHMSQVQHNKIQLASHQKCIISDYLTMNYDSVYNDRNIYGCRFIQTEQAMTGWYSGKNNKICTVPGHSSTGTSVNIPFIPNMYFCFDPDRGGFVVSIGCVSWQACLDVLTVNKFWNLSE